jgi:peroxiredoxin
MSSRIPPDRPPNPDFEAALALDAALSDRLAAYDAMLHRRSPATWAAYEAFVARLKALGVGANAPSAGDRLPPFVLPDETGRLVASADLLDRGPLVVSLNRGNWCPYCALELGSLAELHDAIVANGATLVSITPEIATFNRRLRNRLALDFAVLTDLDNGYAMSLGLACVLTSEVRAIYDRLDIDLGAFQRNRGWFLPVPATFVVDRQGLIRLSFASADFRTRIDAMTIPRTLAGI